MLGFGKNKAKQKTTQNSIEVTNVPTHIAIIPDGNRRWAKLHHVPTKVGHREGAYTFKRMVKAADRYGVKYITFYAFSTENWSREQTEVDALMDLMLGFLQNAEKEIGGDNVVIKVIGDRTRLSAQLQQEIERVERLTSTNTGLILFLAINYGGRSELVHSVREIAKQVAAGTLSADEIEEKTIADQLYTGGCPDPDLLIRTSKEERISNFLLYQMAYTEFYFTDVLWPDFNEEELKKALLCYQNRQRRFGGA